MTTIDFQVVPLTPQHWPVLTGGLDFARASGAHLVEAAPMDHEAKRSADGLYVGPESVFQSAGFIEVARQKPGRPLMRFAF